jgi:DNA-directed RNA polymerase subunit K/omega
MTDPKFDVIIEAVLPGEVKPRKFSLSITAANRAEAMTQGEEQYRKLIEPISIEIKNSKVG